jgi:AraC family transcriptional regulator
MQAATHPLLPLQGPHGLFTVSAAPQFLRDSTRPGWRGAFFTELMAAPEGTVDHGHARYCLARTLTPYRARPSGGQSWVTGPAGVSIWQPGDETRWQWVGGGGRQFLFMDPLRFEEIAANLPAAPRVLRAPHPVSMPLVERILDAMALDLAQGSPAGALVGDSLIVALVGALAGGAQVRAPAGALGWQARERVLEYMATHLAQPMSLDTLAAVAGLGVRQFSRAFRASTGSSPHQYLLTQRVERAKALLSSSTPESLAGVALRCGFADQSQFTRTFVRHTGQTPAVYRAMQGLEPVSSRH